mmetsp:Transcript_58048/g.127219  ORF Transcript_58048/g.127219 Transcript_58048/m.127219 type:complete len:210 (-) Transcript_58048:753-1382(-)
MNEQSGIISDASAKVTAVGLLAPLLSSARTCFLRAAPSRSPRRFARAHSSLPDPPTPTGVGLASKPMDNNFLWSTAFVSSGDAASEPELSLSDSEPATRGAPGTGRGGGLEPATPRLRRMRPNNRLESSKVILLHTDFAWRASSRGTAKQIRKRGAFAAVHSNFCQPKARTVTCARARTSSLNLCRMNPRNAPCTTTSVHLCSRAAFRK